MVGSRSCPASVQRETAAPGEFAGDRLRLIGTQRTASHSTTNVRLSILAGIDSTTAPISTGP